MIPFFLPSPSLPFPSLPFPSPSRQRLKPLPLARNPVRLALADNLLAQPLGLETAVQDVQILHNVLARADDGFLGGDGAVGLDAQLKGREEGVRDFVGGEDNVYVFEQPLREELAVGVVSFVEGEVGGVGDAGGGGGRIKWC